MSGSSRNFQCMVNFVDFELHTKIICMDVFYVNFSINISRMFLLGQLVLLKSMKSIPVICVEGRDLAARVPGT